MRSNAPTTTTPTPQALQPQAASPAAIVPELLTSRQAAELLAIGERSLWRWSRSGVCPAPVRIGCGPRAAVRFRRQELIEWAAAGCPQVGGRVTA
jgi:predicted DNA-binding transcriptional regulator AlpA